MGLNAGLHYSDPLVFPAGIKADRRETRVLISGFASIAVLVPLTVWVKTQDLFLSIRGLVV